MGRATEPWSALPPAILFATTVLAGLPAHAADRPAEPTTTVGELFVTAEKRSENIQHVPMSIQALSGEKLKQLTISNFKDYAAYMPSVSFQRDNSLNGGGSDGYIIYMRGITNTGASHAGPLPTVGTYLDEEPITTIGGTLDVHIYDVARIEVLPGPQGTLYGASSESGTLRIITNQPSTTGFSGAVDLEGNLVVGHAAGYVAEGFVNIPISDKAAVRLVAFEERDPGYIDNVAATRTYATSKETISNAPFVRNDFNGTTTYGGRAALRFDVNDSWTVTPSVMAQHSSFSGLNAFEPTVGWLKVERFGPDQNTDRWVQAALTVTGKIHNFDLTYAGAYFNRHTQTVTDYTDYAVFYDSLFGSGANWTDNSGAVIGNPRQEVLSDLKYWKESNELRLASPVDKRLRFIAGVFQEIQHNTDRVPYVLNDYADALSVPGFPHAIFLLDQRRVDSDLAAFGEATFDITPKLSLLAGIRGYQYHNTLNGFFGFHNATCVSATPFNGAPCTTLDQKSVGAGETHKVNLTYRFDPDRLAYFTYSTGYRPGGINRNPGIGPFGADYLENFEVGWKTSWFNRRMHWNGALYYENWNDFQFTFEGPNGTSINKNAPSARIEGAETNVDVRLGRGLTLSGGASWNDSRISRDFCGVDALTLRPIQNCAGLKIQVANNTPLPFTPKFKGDVTARYEFDVAGWRTHVQGSLLYRDSIPIYLLASDIQAARAFDRLKPYVTADLSVGAERDGRRIELFAKNLFNSHGIQSVGTSCPVATCGASIAGAPSAFYETPVTPLTIGIKLGQSF